MIGWIGAFARFWYHFIIGDDWTIAAAVAVGLLLTALLVARHITAWWLIPAIVIMIVGVDLRRAGRRRR